MSARPIKSYLRAAYRVPSSSQNLLLKRRPIARLVDKLCKRELGPFGPVPDGSTLLEDVQPFPAEEHCRSANVLDLSDKMDAADILDFPGNYRMNAAFNIPSLPDCPSSRHSFSSTPICTP